MLRKPSPSQLCNGCRDDLLSLFRNGFCSLPPARSPYTIPVRRLQSAVRAQRTILRRSTPIYRQGRDFSYTTKCLDQSTNNHNQQTAEGVSRSYTDPTNEQLEDSQSDINSDQLQALQQLEALLGRRIDNATKEYFLNAHSKETTQIETLLQDGDIKENDSIEDGYVKDSTTDTIAILREEGARTEDVARQARLEYGDVLPLDLLTEEEMKIYVRLFGEPESEFDIEADEEYTAVKVDDAPDPELLDVEGRSVSYTQPVSQSEVNAADAATSISQAGIDVKLEMPTSAVYHPFSNDAARVQEVAASVSGEVFEEDEFASEEEDEDSERTETERAHPLTTLGRWSTSPSTIFLPQELLVKPVEKMLGNFSNKHIKASCEKIFGGVGLPDSALTPLSGRLKQQKPIPVDAFQHMMGEMEANAFFTAVMPPTYAAITSVLVETRKRLGPTWLNNVLAKTSGPRVLDAGAGGAGILAWREIVRAHWATIQSSDNSAAGPPASKGVVVTGSDTIRHRAAQLLENTTFIPRLPDYIHARDAPTLEDDRPVQSRKQFDVIIAPHTLFGLKEDYMRKQQVQNLWSLLNPEGGVLILIEKGTPRGFEAIAGARDLLLDRFIASPVDQPTSYSSSLLEDDPLRKPEPGMIVAPCTNHEKCPMYQSFGLGAGRRDFCSFQQRYIRPSYLQRVLEAKHRNHGDVDFSYISVMKGEDLRHRRMESWKHIQDPLSAPYRPTVSDSSPITSKDTLIQKVQKGFGDTVPDTSISISSTNDDSTIPTPQMFPRTVFPPIKRRGHVSMDVCTPWGKIERWTIPRSFGKQAYRDARKSRWGDLWGLGAKTRIPRNLQLGRPENKEIKKMMKGTGRNGRQKEEKVKDLRAAANERLEDRRFRELEEKLIELDELEMEKEKGDEEVFDLGFDTDNNNVKKTKNSTSGKKDSKTIKKLNQ